MNTPIKTNKLISNTINHSLVDKKYDILCVKTSEKYFRSGAYIIDAPALNKNVCAVQFTEGNKFYVMMRKAPDNKRLLRETLSDVKGAEFITINRVKSSELENRTVLQLLLNSLGNVENSLLKFNNITGHFYCFHPKWIIHSKKDNSVLQIKSLEISISPDYRLQFDVRTFTSELLKKKIKFGKKKFKDYPQYVESVRNTLRRKLKDDSGTALIKRQIDGRKYNIPFLKFRNINSFEESKMGVVSSVILRFNEQFSDMARIEFENITDYISFDCVKHDRKADIKFIEEKLQSSEIYIADKINDEYSQEFCKDLKKLLFEEYHIQSEIRKRIVKNSLNICLIHNAEYYVEKDDPHQIQFSDKIVQHITFEDFKLFNNKGKPSSAIAQAIHELMIKADLMNNKITLFDWADMGIDYEISFGIKAEKDEKPHYFFMTIKPDGTFEIAEQEFTFFEENEYNQCIDIFESAKQNAENIKGIIRDEYGNINIIKDTRWVTIPEIFSIRKELENGNTAIKGIKKRNELFPSVIDIKQFNHDNSIYYFAGVVGKSLDDMQNAVNIRKFDIYENSQELFSKLLPLMDIGFVHNRQLTVIPFPFKYLREYVKKLGFDTL